MQIGIRGEVRYVVKRADDSVKLDTGYQNNLILNNCLDMLGGKTGVGYAMNNSCIIGSGNSTPQVNQIALDSPIKGVLASQSYSAFQSIGRELPTELDPYFKIWGINSYRFENLGNVNISEVGLCSSYTSISNYFLITRTLIKDSLGNPTSISVLADETLDIYYKIWQVFDTTEHTGVITLSDAELGPITYNVKWKLADMNNTSFYLSQGYNGRTNSLGRALDVFYYEHSSYVSVEGLSSNLAAPVNTERLQNPSFSSYVDGTYTKTLTYSLGLPDTNTAFKTVVIKSSFGVWQIEYSKVSDSTGLVKTNKDKMVLNFKFTWGRYEGAV